ncbi:MAG TPA: SDR family NAD(P)-dependent oxidoreductase, partial [Afifellaceae bacterium]|nr:SDR family NAD(P)-dependent oxidoreductase [Afifellaceae bacterium]
MTLSLFDLSGKRALVTGSSQGIGLALARGLAAAGAAVVLNARNEDRLVAAAEDLRREGATVSYSTFDVTQSEAVGAAVDALEDDTGPIDILVNNAGIQFRTVLQDYPDDKWHDLMRTNIDSVFFVGRAVARHMIKRRRGKIINIGSVQSELGRPAIAPYAATKGAVKMLTKGMCIDWADYGIQVNAIGPGYFKTPLNKALVENPEFSAWLENRTPAGRWGNVEELAGAAIFLASDASS